jgi:alanine dehydrogenase
MSGVLGRTASYALFIGAYPYLEAISASGIDKSIQENGAFEKGINTLRGKPMHISRLGGIEGSAE